MVIVESYAVAVALCVVTMLCWGSWANTQKLASKEWKFQLFYWDYVIGILLLTLALAFTMGSIGSAGRGFLADVRQADIQHIQNAVLGGIIFNFANILLVVAIDIAGMSVAFPVGIGLALALGVIDNYRVAPGFGLRILVPAMGPAPIALDFAFPISSEEGDEKEVFSFFIGFLR